MQTNSRVGKGPSDFMKILLSEVEEPAMIAEIIGMLTDTKDKQTAKQKVMEAWKTCRTPEDYLKAAQEVAATMEKYED